MAGFLDRMMTLWRRTARAEERVLHVGELPIEVVRKRMRTVTLRVHAPDGRVRVSAPLSTSDAFIRRMVLGKLEWIARHRARLAAMPPAVPPVPLTQVHRRDLERRIPPLVAKWETALGVKVAAWGVKRMRTRWGSCNPSARRIWLSLELARHLPEGLDYVVLHEVAHLVERGHGARFKALLERHMPDWKARRKALRGHNSAP